VTDSTPQLVYFFGLGRADGTAAMKDVLGGKGAGLAEMTNLGIPVPPGFTIPTSLCIAYLESHQFPPRLRSQVEHALQRMETATGRVFGGTARPLLVSVRSGAALSMPGMMETILNLGLNDTTVAGLATESGNPAFAWDSYRRFVQMFGSVVFDVPKHHFERLLEERKSARSVGRDSDLPVEDFQGLVHDFKALIRHETGKPFPDQPTDQLWGAIAAVFESWNTRRAIDYRKLHDIPDTLGTAVNVVTMVFGNMGDDSGTGVAFTRNPSTGEHQLYGEYLLNAQGEDVVSGARTPEPISTLNDRMPEAYSELERVCRTLERHFRDVQDVEFTIERRKLYLLQTRRAQRSGHAAVRISCEMVEEGLISEEEAVARIPPHDLDQLLHPTIDPAAKLDLLTSGLPASPGAASGAVVFDADRAEEQGRRGEPVILVRRETSPEDFHGMVAAKAILTARGGMTSHAAVVARGMGKPCVAGAQDLSVEEGSQRFSVNGRMVAQGEWITVDGSTGRVFAGRAGLKPPAIGGHFDKLLSWADRFRHLRVRVNADTPADAHKGRDFGAEGIGLCRTEHMFGTVGDPRLPIFRQVILAAPQARAAQLALIDAEKEASEARGKAKRAAEETVKEAKAALKSPEVRPYFEGLKKLLTGQRRDFESIFKAMDGLPVTIRLLDPPLHEFLPSSKELELAMATPTLKASKDVLREFGGKRGTEKVLREVLALEENNPMLGLRGCRLGILYPDIYRTQVQAIIEAACNVKKRGGDPHVEIMVPLVATREELTAVAADVREVAEQVLGQRKMELPYLVGTMIELPRAALAADEIAEDADFFSFGTNDLTQTAFGFSRDDVEGKFLARYLEEKILPMNPFESLDERGVGDLVLTACQKGRKTKEDLKLGICGEHGGDPSSVHFFHNAGLDYVSCSPYRVPLARLAAAQAVLGEAETASK